METLAIFIWATLQLMVGLKVDLIYLKCILDITYWIIYVSHGTTDADDDKVE